MSNYIIYNGELYHHGVKGMKWGVRKKYRRGGKVNKTIEKTTAKLDPAAKEARKAKMKKAAKIGGIVATSLLAGTFGGAMVNSSLKNSDRGSELNDNVRTGTTYVATLLASMGTAYALSKEFL